MKLKFTELLPIEQRRFRDIDPGDSFRQVAEGAVYMKIRNLSYTGAAHLESGQVYEIDPGRFVIPVESEVTIADYPRRAR